MFVYLFTLFRSTGTVDWLTGWLCLCVRCSEQSSETVTETPLKLEIKTETSAKKKKVLMLRPRLMHRPPPY